MSRLAASVVLVAGLFAATPALAAPATRERTDDSALEDAAKTRYAEGVRLFKKRKYEEARAAFLQANALRPQPMSTLMLAESALKSGRWLEAVRNFDAYVAQVGAVPPKLVDLIDAGRREARSHLARLRFDVPKGSDVVVDGERPASIDEPLDVMPGVHTIAVTHLEQTKTETVEVLAGRTAEVHPSFAPKALIPEEARPRPKLAPTPSPASAESGAETSLLAPPATTWPVYVAGFVGLAGLAGAAILGGLQANAAHGIDVATQTLTRNGKSATACDSTTGWATASGQKNDDERATYADTCATLRKNQDFSRSHESIFGISLIAGLSGTAIAAGWFFLAPKAHASEPGADADRRRLGPLPTTNVVPWLGPSGAGATVEGRF